MGPFLSSHILFSLLLSLFIDLTDNVNDLEDEVSHEVNPEGGKRCFDYLGCQIRSYQICQLKCFNPFAKCATTSQVVTAEA